MVIEDIVFEKLNSSSLPPKKAYLPISTTGKPSMVSGITTSAVSVPSFVYLLGSFARLYAVILIPVASVVASSNVTYYDVEVVVSFTFVYVNTSCPLSFLSTVDSGA